MAALARRRRHALRLTAAATLLTCAALAACAGDTSVTTSVPRRSANATAQIADFYHPPADAAGLGRLATDVTWITLTRDDAPTRDLLRRSGTTVPFYVYLLAIQTVPDHWDNNALWGDQPDPTNPNSAYFDDALATHPEWFLRDQYGQFIHDTSYLMDPNNPGWQQFLTSQARSLLGPGGWDGLFLDNVVVTFKRPQRLAADSAATSPTDKGAPVPWDYLNGQPYTNESFGTALQSLVQTVRTGATEPTGTALWGNLTDSTTALPDQRAKYLPSLDGWMDEGFASRYSTDEYQTPEQWARSMENADAAAAMGKAQVLVGQGSKDDVALQRFTFGSYLLVADDHTWFRYAHTADYIELWWYPVYDLELGKPLGPRQQLPDGRWRRDFVRGYVIVDPIDHQVELVVHGKKV